MASESDGPLGRLRCRLTAGAQLIGDRCADDAIPEPGTSPVPRHHDDRRHVEAGPIASSRDTTAARTTTWVVWRPEPSVGMRGGSLRWMVES